MVPGKGDSPFGLFLSHYPKVRFYEGGVNGKMRGRDGTDRTNRTNRTNGTLRRSGGLPRVPFRADSESLKARAPEHWWPPKLKNGMAIRS